MAKPSLYGNYKTDVECRKQRYDKMRNRRICERLTGFGLIDDFKNKDGKYNEIMEYYKNKASRLENEFENLGELLNNIKCVCDLSYELQSELNSRNEEVFRLQQVISELQVHLYKEKEHCLKLSAENDELQIQEFEDRKKIDALMMITGVSDAQIIPLLSGNSKGIYIERKLPQKLQKIKEDQARKALSKTGVKKSNDNFDDVDVQTLILKNHSLAAELEHHICISREQIEVLLKERELVREEREIERTRLRKEIDLLSNKLKETQDILCETSSKLIKCKKTFEKEKDTWMEEKDNYLQMLTILKEKQCENFPDVLGYSASGVGYKKRSYGEVEFLKEQILEKEQLAASYQEQIIAMEAEINDLRERAQSCRETFKEKIEKMNSQTVYLKNKYEDLDRRRILEAEGFRTDIRMLRERLKDLEKKLAKASLSSSSQHSEQQLLISARNTLNRARQLEKELINMKSKISVIGINESS